MKQNQQTKIEKINLFSLGAERTKLLFVLLLVSIISQVDRVLPFILVESIKEELKLSDTQIGLITGIAFTVCYALLAIPLARLSDMGLARRVLICCVFFWSLMTGLGGLAIGFLTFTFTRIGVAIGEAGGTSAGHALIVQRIPEDFRGRAISIFSMGIPLGTMIGFALGGLANDTIGWRKTFLLASFIGIVLTILILLIVKRNNSVLNEVSNKESFIASCKELFSKTAFKWLFASAVFLGLSSAPFYIFMSPFIIRTHGLTTSEVGVTFGLLQGILGIIGTLFGGRVFDKIISNKKIGLMNPPSILFLIASFSTSLALFMTNSWMTIVLLIPGMLSFAFMMPFAFGSGHLIAGPKKQAFSISILMIGSGLVGATISPVLVGLISDFMTRFNIENGLRYGLLLVPVFSLCLGLIGFSVSNKLNEFLK